MSPSVRTKSRRNYATVVFGVLIVITGALMMTLTSSPEMKGAAFLWLPAALQLIAGVWLGPVRGFLAGGLGAYGAGILAYGGWGPPDIVMNLVAGGVMNSAAPALLFRMFRIDPSFGGSPTKLWTPMRNLLLLLVGLIIIAVAMIPLGIGSWAYLAPLTAVLLAPLLFRNISVTVRDFMLALFVAVLISFLSACLGVLGSYMAGQSLEAAIFGVGVGWFLGDTISAILGLYILASFTEQAWQNGIAIKKHYT